jgi:hypothetical protein
MAGLNQFRDYTALAVALSALWERNVINQAAVAALFNPQDSIDAIERTKGVSRMSLVPKYNGTIEYDDFDPLDLASYIHDEYVKGLFIQRSLLDDAKYNLINSMVTEHAATFGRTTAYHMVSVFNNAFSSSYPGPDGKPLCATNHSSGSKPPSFNNLGTSPLSHDALVSTRQLMRKYKDEKGNVMLVNPDTLIVPVDLESAADEIVNSVQRSDNANNATNTNRRMSVVVEPLLTDSNNWFVVDSGLSRQYLRWFWRVRPEFAESPDSDYNLGMRMRGYMRYSFGWDTHVWCYGHQVTGA